MVSKNITLKVNTCLFIFLILSILLLGCTQIGHIGENNKAYNATNLPTEKNQSGCLYNNPPCDASHECLNNLCILRKGYDYDNPPCLDNFECINDTCILKTGCQYNNPPCPTGYNCSGGACVKITLNCNDSGSTNDIYTQGEVNYQHFPGHFTTYEDMCDDTRHVKKYFCNASDQPDYDLTMCPSGYKCSSGRCKRKGGGGGYTPPGPCNGHGQACTIGVGACATNGTWVCNGTGLVCNAPSVCGCATPVCGLSACGCADSDGDGFSDAWEDQDYIDINCNGVYDANVDFHFPARGFHAH